MLGDVCYSRHVSRKRQTEEPDMNFDIDNTYATTPAMISQGDEVVALFGEDFSGVVDSKRRNGNTVILTNTAGSTSVREANEEFLAII
jgi:hypothetical protein